jgi:hypothetical protein
MRHETEAALGTCACCGFADPRMLRAHRLADALHSLCANCAALAGRRRLSLEELIAERFTGSDEAREASRPEKTRRGPPNIAALIRERESHLASSCQCATCTSGGRPIHRAPRFTS